MSQQPFIYTVQKPSYLLIHGRQHSKTHRKTRADFYDHNDQSLKSETLDMYTGYFYNAILGERCHLYQTEKNRTEIKEGTYRTKSGLSKSKSLQKKELSCIIS